jgi:tRNA pseudouridine synthase 10
MLCTLFQLCNIRRYNKYSRELSQTPWVVDGKRKSESSVEELICDPLNKSVIAAEWRFSASGREDVDVRMLGTGRPFVVEFINPRRVNFTVEQLTMMQVVTVCSNLSLLMFP